MDKGYNGGGTFAHPEIVEKALKTYEEYLGEYFESPEFDDEEC